MEENKLENKEQKPTRRKQKSEKVKSDSKTHAVIIGIKAPLEEGKEYKYKVASAKVLVDAGAAKYK